MLPNIDLRIQNMIKALEQVILPALPRDQRLARDQAMLVTGHLRMIGAQWKCALDYERGALDQLVALAELLRDQAGESLGKRLTAMLELARDCDRAQIDEIERTCTELGKVVDEIILGGPGHRPLSREVADAILDYSLRHARRERVWFQGNGLDPDRASLPTIEAMMASEASQ